MVTPEERFSAFMKSIIRKKLMPGHIYRDQAPIVTSFLDASEYMLLQTSAYAKDHSILVSHKGIFVSAKFGRSSYLEWDKAEFVLPFKYDKLIEEFIECDVEVDDLYLVEYGIKERRGAAYEIRKSRARRGLRRLAIALIIFVYVFKGSIGTAIDHWLVSSIAILALLHITRKSLFPDLQKFESDNKAEVFTLARNKMLVRLGERKNRISIKTMRYSSVLGPDMMDTQLMREIITYGCKARERMHEIMYDE